MCVCYGTIHLQNNKKKLHIQYSSTLVPSFIFVLDLQWNIFKAHHQPFCQRISSSLWLGWSLSPCIFLGKNSWVQGHLTSCMFKTVEGKLGWTQYLDHTFSFSLCCGEIWCQPRFSLFLNGLEPRGFLKLYLYRVIVLPGYVDHYTIIQVYGRLF